MINHYWDSLIVPDWCKRPIPFPQMFQKIRLCVPGRQELCNRDDANWRKECCPTSELSSCDTYLEAFAKKKTLFPFAMVWDGDSNWLDCSWVVTSVKPWPAKENIHSETYSLLIDRYIQDPVEKDRVFNAVVTMPAVEEKANWAVQWMSPLTSAMETTKHAGKIGIEPRSMDVSGEILWNLCRLRG